MTNSKKSTTDISINEHKQEYVEIFKYLGAVVLEEGSRAELGIWASPTKTESQTLK